MNSSSGIHAALGRIATITTRFDVRRDAAPVSIELDEFEPFGEVYQQAMATRPGPAATGAGTQSAGGSREFATLLPAELRSAVQPVARGGAGNRIQSIEAAIRGVAGAPGVRPVGGYGKMPVPDELAAFGNGRVPRDRLQPIAQSGHRLYAPAAAAWDHLVHAAAADGHELKITDSYRSYDNQVDLARRKGLYKNGGLAAVPGTSNHGWGLAVDADVRDPALLAWLRTHGPRFGWVEAAPREPWHWEFRPDQV